MKKNLKSGTIIPQEFLNTNKKYKNSLVLGKFFPFHIGHKHLIDSALEQSETVHVMVCSLKSESINGWDRFYMVTETYFLNDNIQIYHCEDENPQHPEECPTVDEFYDNYWNPSVKKFVKELDAVFTSEEYGEEFATYLSKVYGKVTHELVDLSRSKYNISGTKVRENVFESWDLLPDETKSYLQKTVCIVGPESTGKSSLCHRLASNYTKTDYISSCMVEEYGRTYTDTIPTYMLTGWDFEVIAKNHDRLIQLKEESFTDPILFIDTDAIVTYSFRSMYMKHGNSGIYADKEIEQIIEDQDFDLYLLLTPEVPHIQDGQRDFGADEMRWRHYEIIKRYLDEYNKPYKIIEGDNYFNRTNQAEHYIQALLKY